jgi:hypothetical protein
MIISHNERHATEEAAIKRFAELRTRLCGQIHRIVDRDGHCKSYEGMIELQLPCAFGGKAYATLHCYVLCPGRHYDWEAESVHELVAMMERDIGAWIREDEECQ